MGVSQEDYLADAMLEDLSFCEWLISEKLRVQPPDPLTEDWRVIPSHPRYMINRCGEVINDRGWYIKVQLWKRTSVGQKFKYEWVNLFNNGQQSGISIDRMLRELFKEDYI